MAVLATAVRPTIVRPVPAQIANVQIVDVADLHLFLKESVGVQSPSYSH